MGGGIFEGMGGGGWFTEGKGEEEYYIREGLEKNKLKNLAGSSPYSNFNSNPRKVPPFLFLIHLSTAVCIGKGREGREGGEGGRGRGER